MITCEKDVKILKGMEGTDTTILNMTTISMIATGRTPMALMKPVGKRIGEKIAWRKKDVKSRGGSGNNPNVTSDKGK
jgi:hypothetical protein